MKRILMVFLMIVIGSFLITTVANKPKAKISYHNDIDFLKIDNMYNIDYANNDSAIFNKTIIEGLDDIEKIEEVDEEVVITEVPVLNYHFFYENNADCMEDICLDIKKFKQQLQYLKDNDYKFLSIEEYKKWLYGEEELNQKAVLITIDDGAFGTSLINGNYLIPVLEEYKVNATLFLITAWWDKENYESKYLDVQSHGYDIHKDGRCGLKNIECLSHDELKEDLQKSIDLLDNNISFAYPFYDYTDDSIEVLKELNFKIAFVGGNRKSTRNDDKYLIPRYPIYDSTSLDEFINMVN